MYIRGSAENKMPIQYKVVECVQCAFFAKYLNNFKTFLFVSKTK